MKKAGFAFFHAEPAARTAIEIDDPEFRATHGYGIADRRRSSATGSSQLNPNQVYYESLGVSAQQAYDKALSGEGGDQVEIPLTNPDGQQTGFLLAGGCEYAAYPEVYGLPKEVVVQDTETLETLHSGLIDRVDADPRVLEARAQWSHCMSAKGWPESEDRWYLRDALVEQFDEMQTSLDDIEVIELRVAADDTLCSNASGVDLLEQRAWVTLDAEFMEVAGEILEKYSKVPVSN